jgi:hypothetical protein
VPNELFRSGNRDRVRAERSCAETTADPGGAVLRPPELVPRVGALRYELGFPTHETSQKLFDEMDFQRAVQCHLWVYLAVSFESIRLTLKRDLGIGFNDLGIADKFVGPESLWLPPTTPRSTPSSTSTSPRARS